MVFNFNYPLLLLLIIPAAAFIIFTGKKLKRLNSSKRKAILALRLMLILLLILSISGLSLKKHSDSTTTVFLVDGSDSDFTSKGFMEDFIKKSLKSKKSSDKAGVVKFGANASVDLPPSEAPAFTAIQSNVNSSFTDIEQGLKTAASLIPSGDRKRIVLISDGLENSGSALKEAKLLKQRDYTIDVLPLNALKGDEVLLKEVSVPETLRLKQKFEVNVSVQSSLKTKAKIKLYNDKMLVAEKNVELQKGENNFAFSDAAQKGGMLIYSAEIEPETDTINKNNKMSALTYVEDMPKILVIEDSDEGAAEIVKMLGKEMKTDVIKPENAPVMLEGLQKYESFIISNVSAERLDDRFLNNLETVIKFEGKGLLVTGGDNSYAPGGYFKTPLEKVLPVNMDIKPKEENPNLGLVVIIDKSGSMSMGEYGVSKVELAKEAAIRATEVLKKQDMVGVIAFDDAVQWVVKTQKLDNLKKIQDDIGTIRPGGGTQILPPIEEAYLSLKNAKTKLKHIILMTDGQAEKSGYETLVENLNRAGITLSTVAVGREADADLLMALAIGGKGRFYKTDEFTDIPKIFTKETFLAGKTYINNRTFIPKLTGYSDILKGIQSVPKLYGYVGTSPKSTAKVVFSSDTDEPILATWQYGLGRTAAWTPDASGMWTSDWLAWDKAATFWKNTLSWTVQKRDKQNYTVKGGLAKGTGSLELNLPPDTVGSGKITATIAGPAGARQNINLDALSPGSYKGVFDPTESGVYVASINIPTGKNSVRTISSGIVMPYSPEYDIVSGDPNAFLKKLAQTGGGRLLKNSSEVFKSSLPAVTGLTDMLPYLITLMIFLLLMDIALRRLNIPFEKLEAVMGVVTERIKTITSRADAFKKPFKTDTGKSTVRPSIEEVKSEEPVNKPTKPKIRTKEKTETAKKAPDPVHINKLLDKKRRRDL